MSISQLFVKAVVTGRLPQKYLSLKHGLNYNNERININQHTTRSMVCCSYLSHIQCFRDFGIPPAGPGTMPQPPIVRTKF
jgi:hypothetical protein